MPVDRTHYAIAIASTVFRNPLARHKFLGKSPQLLAASISR